MAARSGEVRSGEVRGAGMRSGTRPPHWLTALGLISLGAMGAALVYAVSIAVANFSRIGV